MPLLVRMIDFDFFSVALTLCQTYHIHNFPNLKKSLIILFVKLTKRKIFGWAHFSIPAFTESENPQGIHVTSLNSINNPLSFFPSNGIVCCPNIVTLQPIPHLFNIDNILHTVSSKFPRLLSHRMAFSHQKSWYKLA